jgi:hypothetical protein
LTVSDGAGNIVMLIVKTCDGTGCLLRTCSAAAARLGSPLLHN